MSKGSNRRPSQVPRKTVDDNWDKIFNKDKTKEKPEKHDKEGRRIFGNMNFHAFYYG